jgi:signal transduction histidine kinase/ligand-binding sensor domain-containing protein
MRHIIFKLFYFHFFLVQGVFGQMPQFTFKNISTEQGLPENIVLDIKEDKLGFIWIASPNYLSRFDGSGFKVFPKAFDYRTDLENFKLGKINVNQDRLWLITKGGQLELFDLKTEIFQKIAYFKDSIPIPELRSIHFNKEKQILLGSEHHGVYIIDEELKILKHFHRDVKQEGNQILSNKINTVYEDVTGRIWILTDQGVNRIQEGKVIKLLESIHTTAFLEDREHYDALAIGTLGDTYFAGSLWWENYSKPLQWNEQTIREDLNINALYFDSRLRMWSGSLGQGVFVINHGGQYEIRQLLPENGKPNSLADNTILCMYGNGKNGGLWIGTDGGGISFFDEGPNYFKDFFENTRNDDLRPKHITAIQKDADKILWLSSLSDGVIAFDSMNQVLTRILLTELDPSLYKNNRILDFWVDDLIYMGTSEYGLLIIDKNTQNIIHKLNVENQNLPGNRVKSIKSINENLLAILTPNAITLLDKINLKHQSFHLPLNDEFSSLEQINEETIALSTEKSGIYLFNVLHGDFTKLPFIIPDQELDVFPINGLHYKNGWLWAAANEKGILAIELATLKSRLFNGKHGIPTGINYGILAQDSRTLWISHSRGIYKLTYEKTNGDVNIENIKPFQQLNKFEISDYSTHAIFREEDGNMYFGGISELIFFDPDEIPQNKKAVNVVFTEIKVNNQAVASEQTYPFLSALELNHHENSIELNFAALKSSLPGELEFSYRLLGYEEDWVSIGNRNFVAFTNLDPGDYTFEVKVDDNAIERSEISSIDIRINPALYQHIWFKALILIVIFLVLYVFYRLRIQHILAMQEIKEGISADLHDDLGSRLTTIHLLSAISSGKFKHDPEIKEVLHQIDHEVNASSEALHEIVGNIKIQDEDFEEFLAKIRRYISEALDSTNTHYQINSEESTAFAKLSMRKRREIFLIIKELVNNIRKHANALKVNFRIGENDGQFYLLVEDDGIGFNPNTPTHRNGLKNLKYRIEKWNGRLAIDSKVGIGTKIEIWVPFDKVNLIQKFWQT